MLADAFGRIATDLRASVTDRCNLPRAYYMPAEGLDCLRAWPPSRIGAGGHRLTKERWA